ncbi:MAG: glycoside hydrolase family 43 protein [Fibrobacter sp.]|nr:glycoside hydrolase family 43 protein [Fibrobacter sp.]
MSELYLKKIPAFLVMVFMVTLPLGAQENYSAYLFAYFTGNSGDQESIRFALSDDGHNFKALNENKPVISSASISLTGGVRDPHILRGENNDYYMVVTDMVSARGWASNRGIVMLRSTNLVDWQSARVNIPTAFSQFANVDRVWAPQVIFDKEAGKYMVYFSMRLGPNDADKFYYAYANSSFTALETAPKIFFSNSNLCSIDADIIYKDSVYHLFFKTEGSGNGIKSAHSKKLTGGYVLYDKYLQQTSAAVEGSCVFKLINSDNYVLMYDVYTSGRYEFAVSKDLRNFSKDPTPVSFDFKPRHGTVIPITSAEKNALNEKWNPTFVIKHQDKQRILNSNAYGASALNIRFVPFSSSHSSVSGGSLNPLRYSLNGRVQKSLHCSDGPQTSSGLYLLKTR